MVHKTIRLEEADVEYLGKIMTEHKIENFSGAFRFVLAEYQKMQQGKGKELCTRFRSIEEKQDILLDVVNTLLINQGLEVCQPIHLRESPVIKKSREYRKVWLGNLKQRKDWEKNRRNISK